MDAAVVIRPGHRVGQFPGQLVVDGIENVRAVQGDAGNPAVLKLERPCGGRRMGRERMRVSR